MIVVSLDGLRVVEYQTGEVTENDFIRHVAFSTFIDSGAVRRVKLLMHADRSRAAIEICFRTSPRTSESAASCVTYLRFAVDVKSITGQLNDTVHWQRCARHLPSDWHQLQARTRGAVADRRQSVCCKSVCVESSCNPAAGRERKQGQPAESFQSEGKAVDDKSISTDSYSSSDSS